MTAIQVDDYISSVESKRENAPRPYKPLAKWVCPECDHAPFTSEQGLKVHMGIAHKAAKTEEPAPPLATGGTFNGTHHMAGEPDSREHLITLPSEIDKALLATARFNAELRRTWKPRLDTELIATHAKLARALVMCGESAEHILPSLDRIIELAGERA